MIGYTRILRTGIKVEPQKTTQADIKLEQTTLALGQEIVVVGAKPLYEVDVTASQHRLSADDIEQKIVDNVDDILQEQAGVVVTDNEIHIRGGRADENLYIIDGMSIKDPLSGYTKSLYINAGSIKEINIITGGFNAEYGQAMSGVVDVVTKEGAKEYHGGFKYKSDNLGTEWFRDYNTDVLEFDLGGPEPISANLLPKFGLRQPGDFMFFTSGYVRLSDTFLPHANELIPSRTSLNPFAPREENDWHGLAKLTWRITPNKKIAVSYDRSLNVNQGYFTPLIYSSKYFPYEYSKMLDNYNTLTQEGILSSITWTHTLDAKTFYEIQLGRFFTGLHSAVRGKHWTEYEQRQDTEPIRYVPLSSGDFDIRYGDGFWDGGDADTYYDYYSDNLSLEGNITSQPSQRHQLKSGFKTTYTEMQVVHIVAPWVGESGFGRNYDMYRVYPTTGSFYVQDRIVFQGMIVNLGLRYDYWFPGKFVEDAIDDPEAITLTDEARRLFEEETFSIFGRRGKGHLSPRVGISHPVTDRDMLYFHYGHFSQRPKGHYVYAKLRSHSEATYQLFGNPNLNPTTTVAYELGIKHKFHENQVVEFKAYYKDMFDYPTSQNVTKFNPRLGEISYWMYFNADYARSRGIEVRFRRRQSRYLTGNLDFVYAISTGKASTPNANLLVQAGRLQEKTLKETYLRWDKPFRLNVDIHFHVDKGQAFQVLGRRVPDQWGASFRVEYGSGKRYTRIVDLETEKREKYEYGSLSPNWYNIDAKFYKNFSWQGMKFTFIIEAENITDQRIARLINPVTGRAYEPGDVIPPSWHDSPKDLPPDNPSRYNWPRTIKFGVGMRF